VKNRPMGASSMQTDGDETKQSLFAVLRTGLKRRHFHGNTGYASAPQCNVRRSPCLSCLPIYLLIFSCSLT